MLTDRLGLPGSVSGIFAYLAERRDGKGEPRVFRGAEIPVALRAEADRADAGRVGTGPAPRVSHRARPGPLAVPGRLVPIAVSHHERLDRSGYHRGLTGAAVSFAGAGPGGGRRVPGHDRAAAVPGGTCAEAGRRRVERAGS